MTSRMSGRMMQQQEMYELFHDYWNLYTALNSYVAVLRHSPNVTGIEKEATEEISRLLVRIQESMEAIRARALSQSR